MITWIASTGYLAAALTIGFSIWKYSVPEGLGVTLDAVITIIGTAAYVLTGNVTGLLSSSEIFKECDELEAEAQTDISSIRTSAARFDGFEFFQAVVAVILIVAIIILIPDAVIGSKNLTLAWQLTTTIAIGTSIATKTFEDRWLNSQKDKLTKHIKIDLQNDNRRLQQELRNVSQITSQTFHTRKGITL